MSELARAVAELDAGRPVVFPTDTVYGIAARPTPEGIAALFRLKRRPFNKPIPVLGPDVDSLRSVVVMDERARLLAGAFWPGPLTLLLPRAPGFDVALGRASESVAVRVPADPVALSLMGGAGVLAVTSANLSGRPDATTAEDAREAFGAGVNVYLDDGPRAGRPSTIVSLIGTAEVVRAGPIPERDVMVCLGATRDIG